MQGNGMTRNRILLNFSHDSSLSRPYQVSRKVNYPNVGSFFFSSLFIKKAA